jgi:hypothetical protein
MCGCEGIGRFVWRPRNIPNNLRRPLLGLQFLKSSFLQTQRFLSIARTKAIEKQLADICESYGIAAGDAFQGDLLHEISEKSIDGFSVMEVCTAGEKFGRGSFAAALNLQAALSVVGTEI